MAAFAFLGCGKQLIQASPTFEAIENYARAASSDVISVRLTPRFSHDLDGMQARVGPSTTLVYICNPNNPTASPPPRKDVEDFIGKLPASTFVDRRSLPPLRGSVRNVRLLHRSPDRQRTSHRHRTFSSVYGLAGLRLGYAAAAPNAIQRMREFATEDDINTVVGQAASAALDDLEGVNESIRRNTDDRQEFCNQAMARAVKPIESHANFVMMNTFHPAEDVIEHFRRNNILIGRRFPAMSTYIRISLGRPDEMRRFWAAWDMLPYPKHTMQH